MSAVSFISVGLPFIPARDQQQSLDAPLLHFFLAHRQLLCAQHVCWSSGGELPQMQTASRSRGSPTSGGETAEAPGEEA